MSTQQPSYLFVYGTLRTSIEIPVKEQIRGHVELIGKGLLGEYLAPFELAAVLLLVVMVGAAFMARKSASRP